VKGHGHGLFQAFGCVTEVNYKNLSQCNWSPYRDSKPLR